MVVVPWPRNERSAVAGLKTTSYAENVVALAHATERGAGEAIFANLAGNLCEGTGSNVFVGVDGRLVTPPLSSGCLAGITRELVLEDDRRRRGRPLDGRLRPGRRGVPDLLHPRRPAHRRASTAATLPSCPGPLTKSAADAFAALVARTSDP